MMLMTKLPLLLHQEVSKADEGGVVTIDGTTYSLGGTMALLTGTVTDASTVTGGEYQGGTVDINGTTYSLTGWWCC